MSLPFPDKPAESFLSYGLPWANASNTPFRLYKHWVHEGGIASPLIACWPSGIKRTNTLTHQPGHVIDVMATCLDLASVKYPRTYRNRSITPLEGKSLLPVFQGKEGRRHEAIYWEHEGNRAVRQDEWKLVSRHPGQWELYNLREDRTEMNNLTGKAPERAARLSKLYEAWAERAGVMPWDTLQRKRKS